jgi:hypothetical protein
MLTCLSIRRFRYIDDQLTHARIELIASIFRCKHGPLLQRLRYIFRKEPITMSNTLTTNNQMPFDVVFRYRPLLVGNQPSCDMTSNTKPDTLMDEFLTLNKQFQQQNNRHLRRKRRDTIVSFVRHSC